MVRNMWRNTFGSKKILPDPRLRGEYLQTGGAEGKGSKTCKCTFALHPLLRRPASFAMTRSTSLRWWAGVRRNGRAAPSCAWKPSDSAYLGSALKKLQERKGLTEKQIATVMTHFERLEVSPITLTNDSIFEMDRQELRQYADEIAPWRTSMETGSSGRCRSASSITPSIRSSGAMVILRTPAVPGRGSNPWQGQGADRQGSCGTAEDQPPADPQNDPGWNTPGRQGRPGVEDCPGDHTGIS